MFVQDPETCQCSCKHSEADCRFRQLELNERTCKWVCESRLSCVPTHVSARLAFLFLYCNVYPLTKNVLLFCLTQKIRILVIIHLPNRAGRYIACDCLVHLVSKAGSVISCKSPSCIPYRRRFICDNECDIA